MNFIFEKKVLDKQKKKVYNNASPAGNHMEIKL